MPNTPTVAAPPNTLNVTQETLAVMAALSGVITDYNVGSQIRTIMESVGSVIEQQGISALTLALQTIAYSAMSLFDITPNAAIPAVGTETFTTALVNPPSATQSVAIPSGTLLSTTGGVQFSTTSAVTLISGTTAVTAPIQAVLGGAAGNVPGGSIIQLLSGLSYPLVVTNAAPTSGGIDAETPAQAQTRLAATIASLVGGSPVSVANAAIGVVASASTETVIYSVCYEPWVVSTSWVSSGNTAISGNAGFDLYIDNGSGTASSDLITAVNTKLNGVFASPSTPAYRPAGVPYNIYAVTPVYANVAVMGTLTPAANQVQVSGAINTAIDQYFTLPFGVPAQQSALAAVTANAALGALTSLSVTLSYASAPSVAVSAVTGVAYSRVLLNSLSVDLD